MQNKEDIMVRCEYCGRISGKDDGFCEHCSAVNEFVENCDGCGKEGSIESGTLIMESHTGNVYCVECYNKR